MMQRFGKGLWVHPEARRDECREEKEQHYVKDAEDLANRREAGEGVFLL